MGFSSEFSIFAILWVGFILQYAESFHLHSPQPRLIGRLPSSPIAHHVHNPSSSISDTQIYGNRKIRSSLFTVADPAASIQPIDAASNGNVLDSDGNDSNKNSNKQPKKKTIVSKVVDIIIRRLKILVLSFILIFLNIESLIDRFKMTLYERLSRRKTPLNALLMRLVSVLFQRKIYIRLLFFSTITFILRQYTAYKKAMVTEVAYSTFLKLIKDYPEKVTRVCVSGPGEIAFALDGLRVLTRSVSLEPQVVSQLMDKGIEFYAPKPSANILGFVWSALYLGFLYNMATRMSGGPPDAGAGKRRDAQRISNLSFADIAGQDNAKLEVSEVCEFLRNPSKYTSVGARLPSGVLLVGPPGTGKTLLARVTAAEAKVPFFSCSASEFVEIFVGRGPARVRKLFEQASKEAPSIIFIDELDSIGRSRRQGFGNPEQENTLNQILTCMDGLDTTNNGVIVMAATNRVDVLDPALLRAGRFDRIVQCPLPDKAGREQILKVHTAKLNIDPNIDYDRIATKTAGTCGADLSAICNEAAIRTARRGGGQITTSDFEAALQQFFSARGASVAFITEGIEETLSSWQKKVGIQPTA